jgi:hypothetical protein
VPHDDVQAGREHVCRHLSTRSPGNNAPAAGIRNRAQWHFGPVPGGRPPGLQPASPRVRTSPAGQGSAPAKVGNLGEVNPGLLALSPPGRGRLLWCWSGLLLKL